MDGRNDTKRKKKKIDLKENDRPHTFWENGRQVMKDFFEKRLDVFFS